MTKTKREQVQEAVRKFNERYPHIGDYTLSLMISKESGKRNHNLIYTLFSEEAHPNMRWETMDKIEQFVISYHQKKRGRKRYV